MYVCVYVWYLCVYVCKYVCVYVCMYVNMCVCMYVNFTICYHDPRYVKFTYHVVVFAAIMCMTYTILWLKMVSYVQVNYWCRKKMHKVKKMSEFK